MNNCSHCDEPHESITCKWFRLPRDSPDLLAQDHLFAKEIFIGTPDGEHFFRSGAERESSPNGLCIFESLSADMDDMFALGLRQSLMEYLVQNPKLIIKGMPLWRWVLLDALDKKGTAGINEYGFDIDNDTNMRLTDVQINAVVRTYANKILSGMWGGSIEMILFAYIYKLNVHEFEAMPCGGYVRMNMFNYNNASSTEIIRLVFKNNTHYDKLIAFGDLMKIGAHEREVSQRFS
jgi:hypothetical protein